jgi:hypothetical protein
MDGQEYYATIVLGPFDTLREACIKADEVTAANRPEFHRSVIELKES